MNGPPGASAEQEGTCVYCEGLRCAVLMISDPMIRNSRAMHTNMDYAAECGYDFIMYRCPAKNQTFTGFWVWNPTDHVTELTWYIPQAVLQHLPDYDYVVYISRNVQLQQTDVPLDAFLSSRGVDTATTPVAAFAGVGNNSADTSAMIFANAQATFALLTDWMNSPNTPYCRDGAGGVKSAAACLEQLRVQTAHRSEIALIDATDPWITFLPAAVNEHFHNGVHTRVTSVSTSFFIPVALLLLAALWRCT